MLLRPPKFRCQGGNLGLWLCPSKSSCPPGPLTGGAWPTVPSEDMGGGAGAGRGSAP